MNEPLNVCLMKNSSRIVKFLGFAVLSILVAAQAAAGPVSPAAATASPDRGRR